MTSAAIKPNRDAVDRQRLIVLTQSFAPDPAAVGQYMSDVSRVMAARGHQVIVYTAANGYDDPSVVYPRFESVDGVDIHRVSFASVGKRGLLLRAAAAAWFMVRCLFAALMTRNVTGLLVSTSPPLVGAVAWVVSRIRGIPFAYWAMDLNPDQLIALGRLAPNAILARVLFGVDRAVIREATLVIALDRFMAEKLVARGCDRAKLVVLPPWSRDPAPVATPRLENSFRRTHGWGNKIVFLYSGNHTPSNPLSTILSAAKRLRGRTDLHFVFIGSGGAKNDVERLFDDPANTNISSLPYQRFEDLSVSLPAGDVHVASLGDRMVGVVHPCKVYSAMASGRPLLYLGPRPSHVTDIIDRYGIGWHVHHGNVEETVSTIESIANLSPEQLERSGRLGQLAVKAEFSIEKLCPRFCDELEQRLFSNGAA